MKRNSVIIALLLFILLFGISSTFSYCVSPKTVIVGETIKLSVNTSKKIKWSSSDTKIASINTNGKVTGKSGGKAIIKAKYGKKEKSFTVYVYVKYKEKTIKEKLNTIEFTTVKKMSDKIFKINPRTAVNQIMKARIGDTVEYEDKTVMIIDRSIHSFIVYDGTRIYEIPFNYLRTVKYEIITRYV